MPRQLGEAFVRVRPDASGFGKELGGQVTSGDVASGVEKSGSSLGSKFGKALKIGAIGVVGAAGAILGVALTKGFQRLQAIDQARAKLEGLGHSAKDVDGIMTNALAAVKGTAFGLDEAATVAATSVAAGIKPGRQLEKTLRLVADAATIGGTSMADMGAIFNKVAASNKLQGDVIQQLNQQGIPIVQMLSKSLGKSTDQVLALSKAGKVSFADFSKAMQQGLGGSALKSGDTFTGAWKNLMASLSRIGAGLLGGIFPHMAPAIESLTKAMGPLETAAGKIGDKIGKVLGPALENAVPWISHMADNLSKVDFGNVASGSSSLGQAFSKVGDALKGVDWGQVKDSFGQSTADAINVTAVVVGFLADHLDLLAKSLPWLIAGFAAFKAAQAAEKVLAIASIPTRVAQTASNFALASAMRANTAAMEMQNGVERVGMLTRIRSTVATVASTVASKAAAAASKVWAAGQWVLNAALSANPIGIVVVAIAGLVAGLVIAYKKSETFRSICQKAFQAVAAAGRWMWNNVLQPVFKFLVDAIAFVMKMWAKMLGALGHIPGFGWAKDASKVMYDAAAKANNLGDQIKKIPNHANVTIVDNVSARIAATQSYIDMMRRLDGSVSRTYIEQIRTKGPVAGGGHPVPAFASGMGRVTRPTLAVVGDAPEPENILRDSQLRELMRQAAGTGSATGATTVNIYDVDNQLIGTMRGEIVRDRRHAGVRERQRVGS